MRLTEAFTHTPATKPDVVGAQIHDTGDAIHKAEDVIEIKLSGHRLYIESAGNEVGLLTASYALGTKFNLVVSADLRGVDVTYNGVQKLSNFFPAVTYGTWYFKAGAYTHSTSAIEGDDTAYGETDITELSVQHSPISCSAGGATIQGTDGNDVIHGTAGADLIQAGGGNDIVYGLGGNDIVCGGAGKDLLKGGAGNDKLLGQGGRDKLVGGRGAHDVCTGGGGLDRAKRCEIVRSL
jgi:Ca2+-binding RTX toxin-like protein